MVCVEQEPRFDKMLKVMRLQKRGTAGEHTDVIDNTYDISNAERLGKSEVWSTVLLSRVVILLALFYKDITDQKM